MQKDLELELYQSMYRMRAAERAIQQEYPNNQMKTPMHMSIGEEGIVAGICTALKEKAKFYGTYRSHALYLAVTEETDGFFAELYGKVTGPAGGKAGSMHLASPDHNLIMTSAVVGTTIPVAVGGAFREKYMNTDKIAVVFFGDGAVDEGVFWESLNLACLWKLPVLFVCEDNGLAIHTPTSVRRGYDSLGKIARQYNCLVYDSFEQTDVLTIHAMAKKAYAEIQRFRMPALAIIPYYRYLEHVGVNEDFDVGYRSCDEFEQWLAKDPIALLRRRLINQNQENAVVSIEDAVNKQIFISVQKAKDAPFPRPEELYRGVYGE
ncbi:MAG: hypothetical protein A3I26_00415 [Candidatus Yanofskybacteria bacterium RIFCSPLOWO2_02_FULL_43_10]|nr:MAG: hypothetical protein A2742_00235 [Candidatus Yanofskybacteria bacterium RIFCSPHIGHO2_01_FULL_43_32]OGN10990.1 MAG: hypothetical protein A3C69_03375 [Candidatus Yanofskybacteria bacterium RIFCSPHIGHO2_02_FULL_43_12]OGN24117.1 MAG: hypothetical protein A2923_02175 [Candidatus Yanofskybacteria bacterium RIFCSPLOWO2_01_FULL_43_46]OGN30566.1 MAG: hypothetical protein A3I26_00415 [Candidatus Yanofskybacteria bacterium RIFCSPLOWO2_02_FULL_43_10]